MLPSELGLALLRQRGLGGGWSDCVRRLGLIILLLALMWFVRLYLHYYSQWLYLQAIAVPVNKWVCSLWYRHECVEIHRPTHIEHFTGWLMGKFQMQTCMCLHAQTHAWNETGVKVAATAFTAHQACCKMFTHNTPLVCSYHLFWNSPLNF